MLFSTASITDNFENVILSPTRSDFLGKDETRSTSTRISSLIVSASLCCARYCCIIRLTTFVKKSPESAFGILVV